MEEAFASTQENHVYIIFNYYISISKTNYRWIIVRAECSTCEVEVNRRNRIHRMEIPVDCIEAANGKSF